ncbi:MAG: zinc ribbon domain-containing protein, partial [Candidatus Hodarchaeales archaeon]
QFIDYKAALSGVPVTFVDPRNTSRRCPSCGHITKKNRRTRDHFCCVMCGFAGPADHVAAINIAARASVNMPIVSELNNRQCTLFPSGTSPGALARGN